MPQGHHIDNLLYPWYFIVPKQIGQKPRLLRRVLTGEFMKSVVQRFSQAAHSSRAVYPLNECTFKAPATNTEVRGFIVTFVAQGRKGTRTPFVLDSIAKEDLASLREDETFCTMLSEWRSAFKEGVRTDELQIVIHNDKPVLAFVPSNQSADNPFADADRELAGV